MKKNKFLYLLLIIILLSCDTSKFSETPDNKFIGLWQYESNTIYNGITLKIEKDKEGHFKGVVKNLNDNKLVKLFMDTNFVLISRIERYSNFEFGVTENRLAKELFSLYNMESSDKYRAQFINDNLIGLAPGSNTSDPKKSSIKLRKIK